MNNYSFSSEIQLAYCSKLHHAKLVRARCRIPPSMELTPMVSQSQSHDGTVFAGLRLDSDDAVPPPRISRFSFESDTASGNLPSFSSYYESPYEAESLPDYSEDMGSEPPSRGPSTPPTSYESPAMRLFVDLRNKSTDNFSSPSSTLFLDSHSLQPGHSLLCDTPSFLQFKDADSGACHSVDHPVTDFLSMPHSQPMPPPPHSTMLTSASQTTGHEAWPTLDSAPAELSSASNRRVTVHQLALNLAWSRNSSLSALIDALEDTSPGWYQSLMDSTLPASPFLVSLEASPALPPPSKVRHISHDLSGSFDGPPLDMLETLSDLEALANEIQCLPIPRPRTMAFDDVAAALFTSIKPSGRSKHATMPPSASSSSTLAKLRGRRTIDGSLTRDRDLTVDTSPVQWAPSDPCSLSLAPRDSAQPAMANIAHHPKLARTLGLQSLPLRRPPLANASDPPSQRTRKGVAQTRPSTPDNSSFVSSPLTTKGTPTKLVQGTPATPPKMTGSLKLPSLFRRRPAPASIPVQKYELSDNSLRGSARQAVHVSELGGRSAEHTVSGNSVGKGRKQPSSSPTTRYSPQLPSTLGSFLPM